MTLVEEMRKNAGLINEEQILTEGIKFFKNSKKITKLANKLEKKANKLFDKDNVEGSKELSKFVSETKNIADKFQKLEDEYKNAKDKDKKKELKTKYSSLEKEFQKLLKILKQEKVKKSLVEVGGLALAASIVFAGGLSLYAMEVNHGMLSGAADNLAARGASVTGTSVAGATGGGEVNVKNYLEDSFNKLILDNEIRRTNQNLIGTATVGGATIGSVFGTGVISKLEKNKAENKAINSTVNVLKDLKRLEKNKK